MPVHGENHAIYSAQGTGDAGSGTNVGAVDTEVNNTGVRHQQKQYEDEIQSRSQPPGAVLHSQAAQDSTAATTDEPLSTTRMFLSGLNFETDKARIQEILDAFGDVESIHIPISRTTGMHRGFAFIEFSNESELAASIAALNGATLDGRRVTAVRARPYQTTHQANSSATAPHHHRDSSNKSRRVPEEESVYEHSSGNVQAPLRIYGGGSDYHRQVLEGSSSYDRSDHSTHRLKTRGRSKSPEMLGHEEYPSKRIHMSHVNSTYNTSTGRGGGGGGNRDSMLHESYETPQYVPPPQQPVRPPSRAKQVYVGNISPRTDFHGLNHLFSRCGRIIHIDIKFDQAGIAAPHAIITFAFDSSVSDAVHFYSETELDGHTIMESSSNHCIYPMANENHSGLRNEIQS